MFAVHEFILFHDTTLITLMIDDTDDNEVWTDRDHCAYSQCKYYIQALNKINLSVSLISFKPVFEH